MKNYTVWYKESILGNMQADSTNEAYEKASQEYIDEIIEPDFLFVIEDLDEKDTLTEDSDKEVIDTIDKLPEEFDILNKINTDSDIDQLEDDVVLFLTRHFKQKLLNSTDYKNYLEEVKKLIETAFSDNQSILDFSIDSLTYEMCELFDELQNKHIEEELIQSSSKEAFEQNVKTEIEAGKDPDQAVAIAYNVKEKNESEKIEQETEPMKIDENANILTEVYTFHRDPDFDEFKIAEMCCKKIGINKKEELEDFLNREKNSNESPIVTLVRYAHNLGVGFKAESLQESIEDDNKKFEELTNKINELNEYLDYLEQSKPEAGKGGNFDSITEISDEIVQTNKELEELESELNKVKERLQDNFDYDYYLKKESGYNALIRDIEVMFTNSGLPIENFNITTKGPSIIEFNKTKRIGDKALSNIFVTINNKLKAINLDLEANEFESLPGKVTFEITGYKYLKDKYLKK